MSLGVFSDFSRTASNVTSVPKKEPIRNNVQSFAPQQTVQPVIAQQTVQPAVQEQKKKGAAEIVKTVMPIVVPLVAIPVTAGITYALSKKSTQGLQKQLEGVKSQIKNLTSDIAKRNTDGLQDRLQGLTEQVSKLETITSENAGKLEETIKKSGKGNSLVWSALLAAAGLTGSYNAGKMTKTEKEEVAQKIGQRVSGIDSRSSEALNSASRAIQLSGNSLTGKYLYDLNGIQLLTNTDTKSKLGKKYDNAIEKIKTSASRYLFQAPDTTPLVSDNPTLWSVTSEFEPIKEGGLGSVPVEIQNNVTKLGVNIPTFIPMYQQKGLAGFKHEVLTEEVKVLVPPKDSEKAASEKQADTSAVSEDTAQKKTSKSRSSKKAPETTTITRKTDKYTYRYNKKEYDLKKVMSFKMDTFHNGQPRVENVEVYVNDSKDDKGNNKQLVFIKNDNYFNGTIYQTNEKSEEPEKFAFFSKAVYEIAKAKNDIRSVKDVHIDDEAAFESIKAPDALILNDWQASPIAALARYKAPMENAYGQLSDDASKKLSDMRIITIGHNTTYQGSTANNANSETRHASTTNILNTLFDNYTYDIVTNAQTGATASDPKDTGLRNLDNVLIIKDHMPSENHTNLLNMGICLSDYFHPVSENYAKEIISDDHAELAGDLRWALNQRNKTGSLVGIINGNDYNRISLEAKKGKITELTGLEYKMYNRETDIDEIMSKRLDNKVDFYTKYIIPLSKKNDASNHDEDVEKVRKVSAKLDFVDKTGKMTLPELTGEQLAEIPVISSAGRIVSQKGIDILTDAIDMLMKNWAKDFPSKPKPIIYIAGEDGEGGAQRLHIEKLKEEKLSKEDSDRIVFAHGFAPMPAIMAGSDFFLMPSKFEPCGLTQGESFAVATPVIASAVGGIVDTVNRNGKHNGILTDKNKKLDAQGFYEAMKEGLRIFFDEKEQYKSMVKDAVTEDFSWIQKGKKGPVYDYLDKIGISREKLPDVA